MKFEGQHAIVTGGSSGIGLETAKLLVREGANVTLIARDPEKLRQAATALEKLSPDREIVTEVADVADRTQVETAIEKACDRLGPPDILIAAAGMARPGYFSEVAIAVFERTMAVNYFGALYCVRAVLPRMRQRSRGTLVLIASGAALIGLYGYAPYAPSKFALRGLAEALRGELKPAGIHVSVVYPPDTDTPQLAAENRTKPPETKKMTETAGIWRAADVAKAIVRGIEKRQFAIAPGLEMTLLNRFHSLLAPGLNWYFDRIVAKMRKF
ncbi:MAG: SDR family oxidoreductase [Limnospira sp.]